MVIDALITTADELGAALVVNTHDALVAEQFPQRWTMHDGRLTITSDPTPALAGAGS